MVNVIAKEEDHQIQEEYDACGRTVMMVSV